MKPTVAEGMASLLAMRESHLVEPLGPTRLDGLPYLPVRGLNAMWSAVVGAWVVRGSLDIDKLKQAIGKTISAYPHVAGRLKEGKQGKWRILLSKSPVPLTVADVFIDVPEQVMREGHPGLVDPIPWGLLNPPSHSENLPLIAFRVNNLTVTGDTAFVVQACHCVTDATTLARMVRMISDYYQGKEHSLPLPTFEKYLDKPPAVDPGDTDAIELVPVLKRDYTPTELGKLIMDMVSTTERVDIQFSDEDLRQLQARASETSGVRVSRGDALIAYFFTLFNRIEPEKYQRLMNILDMRGRAQGPPDEDFLAPTITSAGNTLLTSFISGIPKSTLMDLGQMAAVVRKSITQANEYEFMKRCTAITEQRLGEIAEAGKLSWNIPVDGLAASLLHKTDFHAAHFGFPDSCRFYIFGAIEGLIRVVAGNPTPNADGTFQANTGAVDVFFVVQKTLKDSLLAIIKSDRAIKFTQTTK